MSVLGQMTTQKFMLLIVIIPSIIMAIVIYFMSKGTEYQVTDEVSFDIAIQDEPAGTITIGLFGETVPKTVLNFVTFASTGHHGYTYNNTIFHRVIKKFIIQGGDVTHGTGTLSIYGPKFPDENFLVTHSGVGFVSMANYGKDTNGCQFFITTVATNWLDNSHVVFGKVVDGIDIVHEIEHIVTDLEDKPMQEAKIINSRSRKLAEPYMVSDDPYNFWDWTKSIVPPLAATITVVLFFNYYLRKFDKMIAEVDELNVEIAKHRELDKAKERLPLEDAEDKPLINLDDTEVDPLISLDDSDDHQQNETKNDVKDMGDEGAVRKRKIKK